MVFSGARIRRSRVRFNAIRKQSAELSEQRRYLLSANVEFTLSENIPNSDFSNQGELIIDGSNSTPETEEDASITVSELNEKISQIPKSLRNEFWVWGILQTSGSSRLTRVQYESVRRLLMRATEKNLRIANIHHNSSVWESLPHGRTLERTNHDFIMRQLCVRSETLRNVRLDLTKRGTHALSWNQDNFPTTELVYVSPLEYAAADMSNPLLFRLMKEQVPFSSNEFDLRGSPENATVVKARPWVFVEDSWISVNEMGKSYPLEYAENADSVSTKISVQY